MGWSLFSGHSCDPDDVRRGHCTRCDTSWRAAYSNTTLTKAALSGKEVRDKNGKKFPLF